VTFNIKQKLLFIIILSVFFTGLAITVAYAYITLNQSDQENRHKIVIAKRGITDRLDDIADELNLKYQSFRLEKSIAIEALQSAKTSTIQYQQLSSFTNLGDRLGLENFAFYFLDQSKNNEQLQMYYARKFAGSVILKDGQHRLFANADTTGTSINNPAIFPLTMPSEHRDQLLVKNADLIYQSWQPYLIEEKKVNQPKEKIVGYFNLQKTIDFDLVKLADEIGVNFAFYDVNGAVLYSRISATNLILPLPTSEQYLTTSNRLDEKFDSLLTPIKLADQTVGYFSVNISSKVVTEKITNAIFLMAGVSAMIVLGVFLLASSLVSRFTSPILALANASLAIASGELNKDIEINRKDELGVLANNFNNMRQAIRQQLEDLKKEISERKTAQERVQVLSQAIEQSPISVVMTDPNGFIEYVNSAFETNTGFSLNDSLGKTPEAIGSGVNLGDQRDELKKRLLAGKAWESEFKSRKKSGEFFWEHAHVAPVFDSNGAITHYLSIREDITLKKEQEAHIYYQAHYDVLTNLPNRFLALDRLTQHLVDAGRSGKLVAVVFLDLDGFKKVNDTLGHEVGDKLLIKAADRLKGVVRKPDTVARLGGDEFVILISGLSAVSNVSGIAEKILECLKQVFVIDSRELILTASAGIAIYPSDGENVSELLKNADAAMYHSKERGRNTFSFFTKAMNQQVARQLAIEEQLHGALERGELEVYYQSQIDIKSEAIIGAEALLRWNNSALGNVSPVEFIPVAEQTGLIVSIGEFVLKQALKTLVKWREHFSRDFRIAINLSPRQFHEPNLVERVGRLISEANVPCQAIELEITEGVLMGGHDFIDVALNELSEMGICIAMDDFGTGYSSLSYLRKYPFDVLKIDRSFVKDITDDHADRELISATIAMAHGLGLKVVAEGVETSEQYDFLRTLNCDFAQGYLFSKPVTEKALLQLANNRQSNLIIL